MSALQKTDKQEKDWKKKYYQSLDKLDEKQKEIKSTENNLTKSILKLTFSHTGVNPDLDQHLKDFRDTLRNCRRAKERKKLIDNIIETVIEFTDKDQQAEALQIDFPAPLIDLLEKIKLDEEHQKECQQLKNKLANCTSIDASEKYITHLADIINNITQKDHVETDPVTKKLFTSSNDNFAEFLGRFSLPGEPGIEIKQLRKRIDKINNDKQYLEIIEDTIKLLIKNYKINNHEILLQLFDWVSFPEGFEKDISNIKQTLDPTANDDVPENSLREIGDLFSRINNQLQDELSEIESYLTKVIARLQEFETHLLKTEGSQNESIEEAKNFNVQMKENAEKLKLDVGQCNDINQIKTTLDTHLEFIHANLNSHLKSEEQRQLETKQRIYSLSQRVNEMESESIQLKKLIENEKRKAHKDALTGIANRMAYDEYINNEFSRWQRYGHNLSMAVIDIDKFKSVNDDYGHKAGDKVLKTVAELCTDHIRNIDFLARYGGEEFILIFPDTELKEARVAAEHLRSEIEKCNFHYKKNEVPITISIGLAEFHQSDDPDQVFQRADKALYAAKESGRNRCLDENDLKI